MDTSNNLQMIHEQEGENFNVTQDMDGGVAVTVGGETQVRQIENDINLIE